MTGRPHRAGVARAATAPIVEDLRRSATEAELLQFVRDAAAWGGWLVYHTHRSDRSEAGFPDVTAVHPGLRRVVFAELKAGRGKVRPDQQVWLEALEAVAVCTPVDQGAVEVYLWRPADAGQILEVFLGHRRWRYHPSNGPEPVASTATVDRPGRS